MRNPFKFVTDKVKEHFILKKEEYKIEEEICMFSGQDNIRTFAKEINKQFATLYQKIIPTDFLIKILTPIYEEYQQHYNRVS